MNKKGQYESLVGIGIFLFVCFALFVMFVGYPLAKPWYATQTGKAEFAQAEQNRQIKILEAQALKESAKLQAEAEIERAKGVAEANRIIGEGLRGNEEYLRYLWIQGLQTNQQQVIYVPTEAGLPILEAGKR